MREFKVGDRILLELELTEITDKRYYFNRVLENDSLHDSVSITFTEDMKFSNTDRLPTKYTLIERRFRVSDRVKCPLFGEGVVSEIDLTADFPVGVTFTAQEGWYTLDGRYWNYVNPTLVRLEEGFISNTLK